MFDEFATMATIGRYSIYQNWMKPTDWEQWQRMILEERAAWRRWQLLEMWNANARMTVTERMKLRYERMIHSNLLEVRG